MPAPFYEADNPNQQKPSTNGDQRFGDFDRWKPQQPIVRPDGSLPTGRDLLPGGGKTSPAPFNPITNVPDFKNEVPRQVPVVPIVPIAPMTPGGGGLPDWLRKPWDQRGGAVPVVPGDTIAPTLYPGKPADEKDATQYQPSDRAYQIWNQSKDAIARIRIETPGGGTYLGTGFFISKDGKLATAYHVINEKGNIKVDLADGRTLNAHIADVKPLSDVALLQVDGAPNQNFKYLELAPSTKELKENDPVYAVGHPRGWDKIYVSEGSYISRDRSADLGLDQDPSNPNRMITSHEIHVEKGNSGSPLLDGQGRVIGVVSFGNSSNRGYADTVEDLHSMLGNSKTSDYFPHNLYAGPMTGRDIAVTGLSALPWVLSKTAVRPGMQNFTRGVAAWAGAATAYSDLSNYDLHAFSSAWSNGSTAEKFNSTLNLGSDVAMLAGSIGLMFGGAKYRTAASLLMGSGSAVKLFNGLASDRTY